MIMTNKLLPVALIAALVGGSVGALVMHKSQPAAAENVAQTTPATTDTPAPLAEPLIVPLPLIVHECVSVPPVGNIEEV